MSIDFIAYIAGILTTYALWPQVVSVWRSKRITDLSLAMYVLYSSGLILWCTYGFLKGLYTIVVPNGIALLLSLYILYRILQSRK